MFFQVRLEFGTNYCTAGLPGPGPFLKGVVVLALLVSVRGLDPHNEFHDSCTYICDQLGFNLQRFLAILPSAREMVHKEYS